MRTRDFIMGINAFSARWSDWGVRTGMSLATGKACTLDLLTFLVASLILFVVRIVVIIFRQEIRIFVEGRHLSAVIFIRWTNASCGLKRFSLSFLLFLFL